MSRLRTLDCRRYHAVQDQEAVLAVLPKFNALYRGVSGQMLDRPAKLKHTWERVGEGPAELLLKTIYAGYRFDSIRIALENHLVVGAIFPHWTHLSFFGDGSQEYPLRTLLYGLSLKTPSLYGDALTLGGQQNQHGIRSVGCWFDTEVWNHELEQLHQSTDFGTYLKKPLYDQLKQRVIPSRNLGLEAENPLISVPENILRFLKESPSSFKLTKVNEDITLIEVLD
jgi:hypothetical protein